MTEAALAVAMAAIAITLFGVILQWLAYGATIDQAQKAAQNVAEMRTEIHGLVGELRGMTERMVEAQDRQFNRMLDAFVTRPGAASEAAERASESAGIADELRSEFESLREQIGSAGGTDAVVAALDRVGERLEDVHRTAEEAARSAGAAARAGGDRALADRPGQTIYLEGVQYQVEVLKLLALIQLSGGERVSAGLARLVPRRVYKSAKGSGLIEVVQVEDGPVVVRLTDEGRKAVEAYGRSVAVAH